MFGVTAVQGGDLARVILTAPDQGFCLRAADDLGNMYQFNQEFAVWFCAHRDVAASRLLFPSLLTFEQRLLANRAAFMDLWLTLVLASDNQSLWIKNICKQIVVQKVMQSNAQK